MNVELFRRNRFDQWKIAILKPLGSTDRDFYLERVKPP